MNMDNKKKVILVLTVCAFGFLAWQIYDLFGMEPHAREQTLKAKASSVSVAVSGKKKTVAPKLVKMLPKKVSQHVPVAQSKQYLSMVEQLEIYRLQREVLDQKLAIVKAEQQILQVKGNDGAYSGSRIPLAMHGASAPLRLSYVAHQGGQWVATVDLSGRFQSVHTGDKLLDGSLVVAINQSGVMLEKLGRRVALTFSGVMRISHHLAQQKRLSTIKVSKKAPPLAINKDLSHAVSG